MNDEWKMPGTEQEENQQPVGEESEVTEATAVKEPEAGETAEAMPEIGIGTKSQQALKLQQEQNKQERKEKSRKRKEAEEQRMFELKQRKKREKHKGH